MTVDLATYPTIRSVQPKLLYDWKNEAEEIDDFPDVQTYTSRAIYEFDEFDVTVTIRPWVSEETKEAWKAPDFDPSTFTEPDGWKIMVTDPNQRADSGSEGNTVYGSPRDAVDAVKRATEQDLENLRDGLDGVGR